ncbi:DUF1707 SHOCT-like domain-containing protein [Pseudonocardia humida]|uniref:DUF1707 domain-containing protein n=1 Tax=Pseudonocardia humida TaxID=2800819 RepID=A0ABT0ZSH5_9PSEU|nr:DUF1707 domain-containing protein [Pseudonocardia humida]MCO1653654.1 DUF1707 domain-containing protein [Pseudonocardia humida]
MDESRPEVRIGDRERREVDARLQQAYADGVLTMTEYEERSGRCWAARTRSELAPLVADLPDPDTSAEAQPVAQAVVDKPEPAPAPPARSGHRGPVQALVGLAVLGAAVFGASQVLVADDGFSAFSSSVVNVVPGDDRVDVGFVFGSTRVVVPADARVQVEGVRIFSGTNCNAACDGSGTRDVVVDASGAFGSLNIQRVGEPPVDNDNDDNDNNDNDNDNGENDDDDDD